MRLTFAIVLSATLAACGGSNTGDDIVGDDTGCTGTECACTAENQAVTGAALTYDRVDLFDGPVVSCDHLILTSAADVAAAFPNGAPPAVATANFATDRVVLSMSNPFLMFAIDDGVQIVVGEELQCQGAAPSCVAHVIHGTTRNTTSVSTCPYRGPDPCLAP